MIVDKYGHRRAYLSLFRKKKARTLPPLFGEAGGIKDRPGKRQKSSLGLGAPDIKLLDLCCKEVDLTRLLDWQ